MTKYNVFHNETKGVRRTSVDMRGLIVQQASRCPRVLEGRAVLSPTTRNRDDKRDSSNWKLYVEMGSGKFRDDFAFSA